MFRVISGFGLLAAAVAMWRHYEVPGWMCSIVGLVALFLICDTFNDDREIREEIEIDEDDCDDYEE